MAIAKQYYNSVYLEGSMLKVFQNVTKRLTQIISVIWTKIVHNLRGLLDSIKGNTQEMEFKRLEFHAIQYIIIFYRRLSDKVEWFYSVPKYLFKPMVRNQEKVDLQYILYSLTTFSNTNVVSFLEKEKLIIIDRGLGANILSNDCWQKWARQ